MTNTQDELLGAIERQIDLLRYARHFLYNEGLITDDEYGQLVQHPGAVTRLEVCTRFRKHVAPLLAALPELSEPLAAARQAAESPGSAPIDVVKKAMTLIEQHTCVESDLLVSWPAKMHCKCGIQFEAVNFHAMQHCFVVHIVSVALAERSVAKVEAEVFHQHHVHCSCFSTKPGGFVNEETISQGGPEQAVVNPDGWNPPPSRR